MIKNIVIIKTLLNYFHWIEMTSIKCYHSFNFTNIYKTMVQIVFKILIIKLLEFVLIS